MSALPRPDIAPGPHRELVDALHDLHHRAGWPSLRRMAAAVGASHTTVSKVFSSSVLPPWGTLELIVEMLGGDVTTFHELWLSASSPGSTAPPMARIAGRQAELATVRRHLETGSGLMVVAGEAGIGKSKLVGFSAQSADVVVAAGHCLPLSMQAPLMPIGEALRAILDVDDGRRLKDALADAPPYVRESLGRLLPELAAGDTMGGSSDEFSRQRLFTAVSKCLAKVHSLGGLGLLLEDLHWADTATLELIEQLVAGGTEVPIVATWRLDDPETGDAQREWWLRMRRLPVVTTLDLAPLSREESGELCHLLGLELDEAHVDSIYRRSRGQPLFTEQLAAHANDGTDLPSVLADLLDHRLEGLDEPAQAITRVLGVADRGLAPTVLNAATGLEERLLVHGLRGLTHSHLLAQADASGEVQLRHPLLAEAVRRRLVPAEAVAVHRRLAEVRSADPDASAAEVAEHWRGAGDRDRELEWRVAAARAAGAQWAARQAAEHWLRALDIWPAPRTHAGEPPLTRPEVYLAAVDALKDSLQFDRAAALSADAEATFPDMEPALRAEFLRRAAVFRTDLEGPEVGLELVEEAIRILSDLPLGVGLVRALARKHQVLVRMGRYVEALGVARAGVDAAEATGDRMSQRLLLGHVAWHEAVVDGDLTRASATLARARAASAPGEDPTGEIFLAVIWTDALLILGAPSEAIVESGRDALALAEERGIADFGPVLVRTNMVYALMDHGRLTEAHALLDAEVRGEPDLDRAPLFVLRGLLEALGGRLDEAATTMETLVRGTAPIHDLDSARAIATVDLWRARPQEAWSRVLPAIGARLGSPPALLLPVLVLGARAGADLTGSGAADVDALRAQLVDLHRRANAGRSTPAWRSGRAYAVSWSAELARLDGAATTPLWLAAAAEWSTLGRPHDAAYCRWRAAQAAIREGHGTTAARLLKRAAVDARGHEPLLAAIDATVRGAGVVTPAAAPP